MNLRFLYFFTLTTFLINLNGCENVKKNAEDNRDDDLEDAKDETLEILGEVESTNITSTCTRKKSNLMHEIRKANYNQFPFMVAIMSPRNEYVCAGSIIANGLVLTTAQCTESISHVLINTTSDKKNDNAFNVIKTEKFPTYTGGNTLKDLAIIYIEKFNNSIANKITISNYTSLQNLNDVEALGFGLNTETGQIKELQYVGIEVRVTTEDKIDGYLDCIDTKVLTCFKDKGGPVIFNNELVGVIFLGENECTSEITSTYAINKRLVNAIPTYTFKAWLDEKISKNIETGEGQLETYPKKPILRESAVHVMTSAGHLEKNKFFYILISICYSKFL